jgi:7,8-dihydropterin-6-yl-methyl-4-(beta-D-ribofuranosyl)aminobenzene 5'-phosphate synthase
MKIITLIENVVNTGALVAEHGLSVYLETENRKILFDTGQTGSFIQNADELGVTIKDIDCLVLSHGHYDHTGGLIPFVEANDKAVIYAKKGIFGPRYHGDNKNVGTEDNEERLSGRLIYIDQVTDLGDGVFIMPHIPIVHQIDTHCNGFTKMQNGVQVPDDFEDELYLAVEHKNKISLITACSHRGITNICEAAIHHFNQKINLILGGFHLKECTTEQYIHISHYLRMLQPKFLGLCHCTGIEKYANLHEECDSHIFYNHTGKAVEI